MSEPFVGEIRMFAGNFAPQGWAFCDGQLMAVSQNDALFSLLDTIYGGDGRTTFGLPDMRGRLPIHAGTGPGLSTRRLGSKGGDVNVTLTVNDMPAHSHAANAQSTLADSTDPTGRMLAQSTLVDLYASADLTETMANNALGAAGGSRSHNNVMPFLCINFIIALFGIYPSRQ